MRFLARFLIALVLFPSGIALLVGVVFAPDLLVGNERPVLAFPWLMVLAAAFIAWVHE